MTIPFSILYSSQSSSWLLIVELCLAEKASIQSARKTFPDPPSTTVLHFFHCRREMTVERIYHFLIEHICIINFFCQSSIKSSDLGCCWNSSPLITISETFSCQNHEACTVPSLENNFSATGNGAQAYLVPHSKELSMSQFSCVQE